MKQENVGIAKHKFTSRELVLMALFATLGMVSKPIVAPMFNLLTDLIRIPGGSCTAGVSLMFLVLGKRLIPRKGAAVMMAAVQVFLALVFGIGNVGIFMIISYLTPGFVIDFILNRRLLRRISPSIASPIAGALGVVMGAAVNNLLFFRLPPAPVGVFYLLGAVSGALGGWLAELFYRRVSVTWGGGKAKYE